MSADLALVSNPDEIAALPPRERGELITAALHESKTWLAVATKGTDPTPVSEFKAWAATVAEMTRQKGLARDIQMDAQEMVRRAERGIGLTVRNGQASGDILKPGENAKSAGATGAAARWGGDSGYPDEISATAKPSSTEWLTPGNEMTQTYNLTDGVTDDQFDEALTEAREEGNVSRANVIRKVTDRKLTQDASLERRRLIRDLADRNYTSRQIANHVGMRIDSLGKLIKTMGIEVPADAIVGNTRHINPERVISETVTTLEGLTQGLGLLADDDYDQLDPTSVEAWSSSLTASLKALNKLRKELDRVRR